ncbi:FAD:protein FMN transferase [Alkaliphilus transvaalensis]|uniref:FAD:protein FMN transferase n=1 Tax=Alkaliphilus transvaalensis TaxID=114628 RepID=UPI00047E6502|nr:FAD:protein FMN transferase [Alkaliphilus transvaalensis]
MKKAKKYIKFIVVPLILITMVFNLTACQEKVLQQVDGEAFVLGTYGQIRVFAPSQSKGNKAIEKAFQRIRDIENTMSTSIENSDVYNINQNAGQAAVKVSDDTLYVIEKGIEYKNITKGNFNITLGSLIELWGIGKDWQRIPAQEEIIEAQKHIDINQLEVEGNNVKINDPNMLMDLGGIAKGYAVDEAVKVLKANGIESGFVNLGGDIFVFGEKPDQSPWYIGIQKPELNSSSVMARIAMSNESIVSSGDYERYFIEEDVRYHHIIDPATGYPSDSGVISVTILSDKAIDGDVLSTAVFILGLEEGLALIETLEDVEVAIITSDKLVHISSGLDDKIEILDKAYRMAN